MLHFSGAAERRLNCFDEPFIEFAQYFNERAYSPFQHRVGLVFKLLTSWLLCTTLSLSLTQSSALSRSPATSPSYSPFSSKNTSR